MSRLDKREILYGSGKEFNKSLPHVVRISHKDDGYSGYSTYLSIRTCGYSTYLSIRTWVKSNTYGKWYSCFQITLVLKKKRIIVSIFRFENETDAVIFKLYWN